MPAQTATIDDLGRLGPGETQPRPERIGDRGLNLLEILSHLKVAEQITGNPRYAAAASELIAKHAYAINTVHQKILWPGHVNHSDDELAFLAFYPLLLFERDPKLRVVYLASLERSWKIGRAERSPFSMPVSMMQHRWARLSGTSVTILTNIGSRAYPKVGTVRVFAGLHSLEVMGLSRQAY
jgi:hypothetical protein